MTKKQEFPADPRFKGATPEKLVRALRKPNPKKAKTSTKSRGNAANA